MGLPGGGVGGLGSNLRLLGSQLAFKRLLALLHGSLALHRRHPLPHLPPSPPPAPPPPAARSRMSSSFSAQPPKPKRGGLSGVC